MSWDADIGYFSLTHNNVPCFPTLCCSAFPMSSQLLYLRNAQDSCLKHEITYVHTLHTGSPTSLELHIIAVVCRFITERDPWWRAGKHCLCSEEVALATKLVVCCWVVCVMFQLPYLPCIHLPYMELWEIRKCMCTIHFQWSSEWRHGHIKTDKTAAITRT